LQSPGAASKHGRPPVLVHTAQVMVYYLQCKSQRPGISFFNRSIAAGVNSGAVQDSWERVLAFPEEHVK